MLRRICAILLMLGWAVLGTAQVDSTQVAADSLNAFPNDSLTAVLPDSVLSDSARAVQVRTLTLDSLKKNSTLEEPFKYTANDSIVFDLDKNVLYLYNKSTVKYQQMELEAERVRVEWLTQLVYAEGIADSTGELKNTPVFKEKEQVYHTEQMRYNYKTRKGKIIYARTNQDGDVVLGDSIKRNPDNTYFIKDGKFTTCDADHPHFYIRSKRMKVIPKDKIISGPLQMIIADIPTPLALPFGFFPFRQSRQSGIIFPEPGVAADRGYFLRNGGYYFPINDYMDVKLLGDVFSEGGFRAQLGTSYRKRYRFDGDFNFEFSRLTYNESTDPDFRGEQYFFIRWTHNQPISPTANFRADVNAGSSQFLQRVSLNLAQNLQNTLQSSINYTKSFPRAGWRITLNASHRQELASKTIQLTVPQVVLNRDRFYPFRNLVPVGKGNTWYSQIGVSYNSEFQNSVTTRDSLLFTEEGRKSFRNGMRHNVGVNTNIKLLKYITVTPAFNMNEFWYLKTQERVYVPRMVKQTINVGGELRDTLVRKDTLITQDLEGFFTARDFNFSTSASTILYGVKQTRAKNGLAFRHTIQPSLAYRYQPDFSKPFWNYYRDVQIDTTGRTQLYSRFQNGIYGGPGAGEQQAISFSLNNVIEMKYLPNDTTQAKDANGKKKYKYITLMDALGFSASYNLAAENFKLSPIGIYARNNILNNKINLNFNASLDPYALDAEGKRIDTYLYAQNKQFARLTNASFSIATSYSPTNKKKKDTKDKTTKPSDAPLTPQEELARLYQPFALPITFTAGYTMSYNKPAFESKIFHSLNLSGTINLTTKWNIRVNTNYDFENMRLGTTNMSITRDLHCWQMSFDVTPFGRFQRYLLTIGVKGRSLQDLKIQKRREWQDQFTRF